MVQKSLFSGRELGSWLREARREAGLTQVGLAKRMGIRTHRGQAFITALETGRVRNPKFLTIVRFTRACGVRMADFGIHFDWAGQPPISTGLIDGSVVSDAQKRNLKLGLPGQVAKYQHRMRFPRRPHGKPIPLETVQSATEKFRDYRVQVSLVEGAARRMLDYQDFPGTHYGAYLAMTRKILSILRRHRGPERSEKLAAISGLVRKMGLDPKVMEKLKKVVIEAYRGLVWS